MRPVHRDVRQVGQQLLPAVLRRREVKPSHRTRHVSERNKSSESLFTDIKSQCNLTKSQLNLSEISYKSENSYKSG